MMKKICIFILIVFCATSVFAQQKNEVEERIKKKDVHKGAIRWLNDAYEGKKKTKWYLQTENDNQMFEAKLKYKNKLHSIEFDLNGNVKDIEILVEEDELKPQIRQALTNYFEENYSKYSISKIQIQYTGDADDLEDVIDENEFEDITVNYEIEYYGKTDDEYELWEGLFDADGNLIRKRVVVIKATDNLDY